MEYGDPGWLHCFAPCRIKGCKSLAWGNEDGRCHAHQVSKTENPANGCVVNYKYAEHPEVVRQGAAGGTIYVAVHELIFIDEILTGSCAPNAADEAEKMPSRLAESQTQ